MDATLLPGLPDEPACVCVCLRLSGEPFALSHRVPAVCLLTLTEIHSLADGPVSAKRLSNATAPPVNNASTSKRHQLGCLNRFVG